MSIKARTVVRWSLLTWVAVLGCAADATPMSPPSPQIFVGDVSGSDARVGIIAMNQRARFYFCGGAASYSSLTRWLTVDIDAARDASLVPLHAEDFGLDPRFGERDVSGTLAAGLATSYAFHATEIVHGTNAGLYEATAACGKVGLIVTQGSKAMQASAQGACIATDTPTVQQVNPLLPIARAADGTLAVELAGGSDEILLHPAKAPE